MESNSKNQVRANKQKSISSTYIYVFLRKNEGKKFTMTEIGKILSEKFGVYVERKSLSRTIHALEDSGLGIVISNDGVYYSREEAWILSWAFDEELKAA